MNVRSFPLLLCSSCLSEVSHLRLKAVGDILGSVAIPDLSADSVHCAGEGFRARAPTPPALGSQSRSQWECLVVSAMVQEFVVSLLKQRGLKCCKKH